MQEPSRPIVVFTDGAAKGNPGPGGWGVVVVTPDGEVTELGGRAAHTTNNRMELTGAINGLGAVRDLAGPVVGLHRLDLRHPGHPRVDLGLAQARLADGDGHRGAEPRPVGAAGGADRRPRHQGGIDWHYVRGHVGTPGNERVDAIADGLAQHRPVTLYSGPLHAYEVAILDLPSDTTVPARKTRQRVERWPRPHSYLSVVDGQAIRHTTWADCERRVKGRSGARFKKAMSPADEIAILRGWNVDPGSV